MKCKDLLSAIKATWDRSEGYIFDIDGTIKDEQGLYPEMLATFQWLSKNGVPFFFLSNDSAQSCEEKATQLISLGITTSSRRIMTCRDILNSEIAKLPLVKKCYIGTNYQNYPGSYWYDGEVEAGTRIIILGPRCELDLLQIQRLFNYLYAEQETQVWVVNSDLIHISHSQQINFSAGILGEFLLLNAQHLGLNLKLKNLGKPSQLCFESFFAKTGLASARLQNYYFVGDSYYSDIAPALKLGLKTIFVASGHRNLCYATKLASYLDQSTITLE